MRVPESYSQQYQAFCDLRAASWARIHTVADLRDFGSALDELGPSLAVSEPDVVLLRERAHVSEHATVDVLAPRAGTGSRPLMVFLHGGAWVMGSARGHRQLASRFAEQGFTVVSVDYRLAPEHPFPAGLEDCAAAVHWAVSQAQGLDADADRLVLAGDSAGANLAAALAAGWASLPDSPRVLGLGLLYGAFDITPLVTPPAPTPGQPATAAGSFAQNLRAAYLGEDADALLTDPRVNPILDAEKLPPASLVVGGADPLAPQHLELALRLQAAGIRYELQVLTDYPHAFAYLEGLEDTLPAIRRIAAFLTDCTQTPSTTRGETTPEPMPTRLSALRETAAAP